MTLHLSTPEGFYVDPPHRPPPTETWAAASFARHEAFIEKVVYDALPGAEPLRDREGRPRCLGSGRYGAVFETEDRRMVLKITSDPTEVGIANVIVSAGLEGRRLPDGIVRYNGVLELPVVLRRRRAWALWRERARNVGAPTARGRVGHARPVRTMAEAVSRFEATTRHVARLAATDRSLVHAAGETVRQSSLWAEELPPADLRQWNDRPVRLDPTRPRHTVRAAEQILRTARQLIATMRGIEPAVPVADALGYFLERGILIADVHPGNLGRVRHHGRDLWAIIDPGHVVELWPNAMRWDLDS